MACEGGWGEASPPCSVLIIHILIYGSRPGQYGQGKMSCRLSFDSYRNCRIGVNLLCLILYSQLLLSSEDGASVCRDVLLKKIYVNLFVSTLSCLLSIWIRRRLGVL